MPTFEYEPLIFSLELKTLDEKKYTGNIDGAWPSGTTTTEEEPWDLRGGRDSPKREVGSKTYALEQTLEPIKSIVWEVSSQEYAFVATKIKE